jgi:cytochrome c oxidase subunit 2
MPEAASTVAGEVDAIYFFILYLSAFFFAGIVGATIYFALKYKRRGSSDKTSPIEHNSKLEFWWSFIPGVLLIPMFAWGFQHWVTMQMPPANTLDLRVTARQWSWGFEYPREGITSDKLVVPVDTAIKLTMTSSDVIHSFYVPEFRIKKDVLPGRYTVAWFQATQVGTYNVLCAEYCGKDHSRMISRVEVLSKEDYTKWVDSGGGLGDLPPAELGKIYFERFGCAQCHSVDGTPNTGPTLQGVYGQPVELADGTTVIADDDYIKSSIENPGAQVVKGFAPRMPSFKGKVKDKQFTAIIEFLKSLKK